MKRTILAGLILIVSEGTIQRGQLSKLISLERVLSLGNRCGLNPYKHRLLP